MDVTPPLLSLPSDFSVPAEGAQGANVTWTATATDNRDGAVPVNCMPAPGLFPVGDTLVSCTASDRAGNTASGSFSVTIDPLPEPPGVSGLSVSTPTATTATATFSVDWKGATPGTCTLQIDSGTPISGSCSSISAGGLSPGQNYAATVRATASSGEGSAQAAFQTPGRTSITSYDRMAPGAPYHGYFLNAWQSFTAQSNTITSLGVTVGRPNHVPGQRIRIRMCSTIVVGTGCSGTIYVDTTAEIQNYGNTAVDVGDIPVVPGQTYFVNWSQPAGLDYVTYWWAGGTTITTSDQMQMIVQGYNR
jgi:hypothetical protein